MNTARQIWETVTGQLDKYYPAGGIKGHFQTLGNESKSNEELIEPIFAIIKRVKH